MKNDTNLCLNGDSMRSAIKQVASARFGVTSLYLLKADELQDQNGTGRQTRKGGQLPGHKVDEWIGKVRQRHPAWDLISPPRIMIFIQLGSCTAYIRFEKCEPECPNWCKAGKQGRLLELSLPALQSQNVSTHRAGHDGGTGASPVHPSSMQVFWELGLAETHQTLVKNKLRSRVVVQADGQLKTGRDIAVPQHCWVQKNGERLPAALVVGRMHHDAQNAIWIFVLWVCGLGSELRSQIQRQIPDHVVNFFKMITQELREIMAGIRFSYSKWNDRAGG